MANETRRNGWNSNIIRGLEKNPHFKDVFGEFNKALIIGVIDKEFELDHAIGGRKFYRTQVSIKRLSDNEDKIQVILPEEVIKDYNTMVIGKWILILGEFHSFNQKDEKGKSHLKLFVFGKKIMISSKKSIKEYLKKCCGEYNYNNNVVILDGYVCKPPIFRKTPLGGEKMLDLNIAVNRKNKSDYIPCIAWNDVAEREKKLKVGDHVQLYGRMQSRDYYKKSAENPEKGRWKVAYELSIIGIKKI